MDERKKLGGLPSFWIKITLAIITIIIIFSQPTKIIPTLTLDLTLFQSGFISLIILVFWLYAYHFLRSEQSNRSQMNYRLRRFHHIKFSIIFALIKSHEK